MGPAAIPWLIGASVAGTVASVYQGRQARKASARAAQVQRRRREIETRKAQVANIEQGRQVSGSILNTAAQTGGGTGGSATQGAVSSVSTQTATNLTFNAQLQRFAERTEQHLQKAQLAQWQSGTYAAVASTALSFAALSSPSKPGSTGSDGPIPGGR